jgi:hypothetical protein
MPKQWPGPALAVLLCLPRDTVQAWEVGEVLDVGNFLEDAVFLEQGKQLFQKSIVTVKTLSFQIRLQKVFNPKT